MVRNADASARFQREIQYLTQLQHQNILPLYDSGDASGILFYVTSYIEGRTLRDHLAAQPNGCMAGVEVADLIGAVADALDYAHARNVLHRDIKPANILIRGKHALIADFGTARAIQLAGEAALTDTGVAVGTPAYMSPEQLIADRHLDARSDVFALGSVVYEMLAGVPPFMGVRGVVDNRIKFTEKAKPIAEYRSVDRLVDDVIHRAIACDRNERFESAGAFAAALNHALRRG
jgi:serine/threonine-protein kinase